MKILKYQMNRNCMEIENEGTKSLNVLSTPENRVPSYSNRVIFSKSEEMFILSFLLVDEDEKKAEDAVLIKRIAFSGDHLKKVRDVLTKLLDEVKQEKEMK